MRIVSILFVLLGCGSGGGGGSDKTKEKPPAEKTESWSYAVAATDDLPKCNSDREGQLAYVKDEKKFYSCSEEEWGKVDITGAAGADGMSIAGIWKYEDNDLDTATDLNTDSATSEVYLAYMQLIIFSDGSKHLTATYSTVDEDSNGDEYSTTATHSIYIVEATEDFYQYGKIGAERNYVARYELKGTDENPQVGIKVNLDSYSDDTEYIPDLESVL